MLLTIGMIVKNEEKWLDKCLSAIKPILDNVDSELIITDTGSVDNTVDIAKKYTDIVLHFDWCDDFSAARNTGLEKARGEWFMYLDADDIFESCDNIIDFFNSGEYKKYNSASYIGKNIVDHDGHFALNKQPRLTKILKNTRFKNVVHEVFTTYGAPKKDINDIAVHYGYLYENEEQREKKTARNRDLLLKRLEKEKNTSAFVYVQLAENEDNPDEGLKYIEAGIKNAKRLNDISMIPLMKHKSNFYLLKQDYSNSLAVCNDYFRLDKVFRPGVLTTDMEILAMKAWNHYCLKQYSEAVETYTKFFDIYERVNSGQLNTADSDIMIIQVASESNYLSHVVQFLISAEQTGKYDLADRFIRKLEITKYLEGASHIDRLIDAEIKILTHFGFDGTNEYIQKHDEAGITLFIKKLEQVLFYIEDKKSLINQLKMLPETKDKSKIYEAYFSGKEIPAEQINDRSYKNDPGILMIAMNTGADISGLLGDDSTELINCAENGYKNYYGFNKAVDSYDVSGIKNTADLPAALVFYEACMKSTVGFTSPKPGVFVILNANRLLEKFGDIGIRIQNESEAVSDMEKAAVVIGNAAELRKRKAYKDCISELKKAIQIYEPIAKFVSDYSKEVLNEYNDHIRSAEQGKSEMERLSAQIKSNIRGQIAAGNIEAAAKMLAEYKTLVPGDNEIGELENEINCRS